MTVDLYEDLQCPNCKAFEAPTCSTIAQLVAAGTVQARYHPMAFLDTPRTTTTRPRAQRGRRRRQHGRPRAFQKFHDLLYANQPPEKGTGSPTTS